MTTRSGRTTYLTYDGLLEPLGYSQVVRPVVSLARRGMPYRIVSFERRHQLADRARVEALERELAGAGVEWDHLEYAGGGLGAFPENAIAGARALARHARTTSFFHARSYVAAFVARMVARRHRIPYLFDARGYWIDERREAGRYFRARPVLRVARVLERGLYEGAAAMVGLTALHVDDVRRGVFGRWRGGPTAAIPTCADYDEFRLREDAPDDAPDELRGRFVVGLVGSINFSYHTRESLDLARRVLRLRPDAVLVILTQQRDGFAALAAEVGLEPARTLVRSVPHPDMPRWVRHLDVVPQLLVETPAKRGSMPTKLGEIFASGVRPVHFGCNSEVREWVRRAGTGLVLDDLSAGSLDAAAVRVAAWVRDEALLRRGREITAAHFSLAAGVDRYAALFHAIGGGPR